MVKFSFKEVAPCLFAIFIDILGFGLVAPLLVALFTSPANNLFGIPFPSLRYLYLSISLALYPLLMFFGTSFIGDVSDVVGRKKTLLFSMMGMVVSFILMGCGIIASSFLVFILGRALSGLVSASQSVALATISDLSTPSNKAVHLSYVALVQCIGFIAGPLMGGVLAGATFYGPFFWAALFALGAFFWIAFCFEETFIKKSTKKISPLRFITVFVEAYRSQRIKELSLIFLLMQIGVGLYLPIILIGLTADFKYTPLWLGLFNGYLGVGFAIGLLFVLPFMLKRLKLKIEQIVSIALFTTLFAQFFSSIFHSQRELWLLGFLYAVAVQLAFSGMFTSFSNATDQESQGWVMGIAVAVMAVAWAVAGFGAQLVQVIGVHVLIFVGSVFLAVSALLMKKYCANHPI